MSQNMRMWKSAALLLIRRHAQTSPPLSPDAVSPEPPLTHATVALSFAMESAEEEAL